jgi:hypothetical protein
VAKSELGSRHAGEQRSFGLLRQFPGLRMLEALEALELSREQFVDRLVTALVNHRWFLSSH